MPRNVYRHKPRSKETMRIRVNSLLKRLLKKQEQKKRLRSEGGAGTLLPGCFGESDDDIQFLRGWVRKHNISEASLSELLCILRMTNPSLPADPRTTMQTPKITDIRLPSPDVPVTLCKMHWRRFWCNHGRKYSICVNHVGVRTAPCDMCGRTFASNYYYKIHIEIVHQGSLQFVFVCPEQFYFCEYYGRVPNPCSEMLYRISRKTLSNCGRTIKTGLYETANIGVKVHQFHAEPAEGENEEEKNQMIHCSLQAKTNREVGKDLYRQSFPSETCVSPPPYPPFGPPNPT
ncbi:unnamed protein product [Calicophoron daubneyi]|uniref:C2H2-type domain-containing protein n=1 Tax=Calicophoron daubneyi TaxID=300641 RepID=A0AAV2TJX1_CALDB